MLDNNIGYIRISSFSENTAAEFKTAYEKLIGENMNSLIIDLRQNPGGLINSVVDVANIVAPKGLIVSMVRRDGSREEYFSENENKIYPNNLRPDMKNKLRSAFQTRQYMISKDFEIYYYSDDYRRKILRQRFGASGNAPFS